MNRELSEGAPSFVHYDSAESRSYLDVPKRGQPIPEEKQLELLRHQTHPGENVNLAAKLDNQAVVDELAQQFHAAWAAGPQAGQGHSTWTAPL